MPHTLSARGSIIDGSYADDTKDVEKEMIEDVQSPPAHIDPVVERRLIRKLDMFAMPTIMLLYLYSSLDRGNLGNLRLLGLVGPRGYSPDPTGKKYGLLVSVFFIGYAVLAIPFGVLAKKVDQPHLLVGIAALLWGAAATASAATNTWAQGTGVRFALSVGEAMYQPVVALMLARWYSRRELAMRFVLFYSTQAVAGCINGLIGYALSFSKSKIAPWRLLYLIDGLPTIALAFWAFYSLPGKMDRTKRLTQAERECAMARLATREAPDEPGLNWRQMVSILWSWPIMLPAFANMCAVLTSYVIQIFLPVLIKESGYSGALAQLYTLIPYGTALVTMITCGYFSDRTGRRAPFVIAGFVLMFMGNAMLTGIPVSHKPSSRHGRLAALTLMQNGALIIIPMKFTWLSENAGNQARRSVGIPLAIAVAQAISAVTGFMFPESDKLTYRKGTLACLGISVAGVACSVSYLLLCIFINRRRDRKEGRPEPGFVPDTATYADKAKGFRYSW